MQARRRIAMLLAVLAGVVAFVVLDSPPDRETKSPASPAPPGRHSADADSGLSPGGRPAGRSLASALPERASLGESAGDLFVSQSWQPPPPKAATAPPKPIAPPMPYRFAGKLMQSGELQIYLSKGDMPVPIKQGEILEGNYRVEAITDDRVTLVYVPLGQTTIIPVTSALSAGTPAAPEFGVAPIASGRVPALGPIPPRPTVEPTARNFFLPQRDSSAAAEPASRLPPLLWESARQAK